MMQIKAGSENIGNESVMQMVKQVLSIHHETQLDLVKVKHLQQVMQMNQTIQMLVSKVKQLNHKNELLQQISSLGDMERQTMQLDMDALRERASYLEKQVKDMTSQRDTHLCQHTKQIINYRDKINKLEDEALNEKKRFIEDTQSTQKALKQEIQVLKAEQESLIKQMRSKEEKQEETSKNLQFMNKQYYQMKQSFFNIFQPFFEDNQFYNHIQLLQLTRDRIIDLQEERSKVSQVLEKIEGNPRLLGHKLEARLQQILNAYNIKISKKQHLISQFDSQLNQIMKNVDSAYQFDYGFALIDKVRDKLIDFHSQLQTTKRALQEQKKISAQTASQLQNQIKDITEQMDKLKQSEQKWSEAYTKLDNKYKEKKLKYNNDLTMKSHEISRLQSQLSNLQAQFSLTVCNLQKDIESKNQQLKEFQQKQANLVELKQKCSEQQSRNKYNTKQIDKLKDQIAQLNRRLEEQSKQITMFEDKHKTIDESNSHNKGQLQQKQAQIDRLQILYQQSKKDLQWQAEEIKRLEKQNKNSHSKQTKILNDLQSERVKLNEIEKQLVNGINNNILKNNKNKQVSSYKEAIQFINKWKVQSQSNSHQIDALFKIHSLSESFHGSQDWVKEIISEYCGDKKNFKSQFICRLQDFVKDWSKYLSVPNIIMICKTDRGEIFCIFITKLTVAVFENFPAVLFSCKHKLRYPNKYEIIKSVRPSSINSTGVATFGRIQLTIDKNLAASYKPNKTGYFGLIDTKKLFGIDESQTNFNLESVEMHKIYFD